MEDRLLIEQNRRVTLSTQQLVDCTNRDLGYGSHGCNSGSPRDALNYIFKYYLTTEAAYGYVPAVWAVCMPECHMS